MSGLGRCLSVSLIGGALLALVAGCKREEGAAPPPSGTPPPVSAGAESAGSPAAEAPSGREHGPSSPLPPGHPAVGGAGGEGAPDPRAHIAGRIELGAAAKDAVKAGDPIFLVARLDDGTDHGPMVGVKRLEAGSFPLAFAMEGDDMAIPGDMKPATRVLVSARVDKDGDALTKRPGDVVGASRAVPPVDGLKIVLDTVLK